MTSKGQCNPIDHDIRNTCVTSKCARYGDRLTLKPGILVELPDQFERIAIIGAPKYIDMFMKSP